MSVEIKRPNITGTTDREKLLQTQSYLYQLAKQLQWAFDTIDTTITQTVNTAVGGARGQGKQSAADRLETFAGLKNLIIKSADIVDAYYEEINKRLVGLYVAQSDFGVYAEETAQDINANSTQIEQAFTNIQSISNTVASVESILVGVNAYINSGLLYYDEHNVPVYGIEVGQRTQVDGEEVFNKYARFTANKLSFYDENSNEVAYISDYKLYITNVEITGSFKQGHLVSEVQNDGSIVRRVVGG